MSRGPGGARGCRRPQSRSRDVADPRIVPVDVTGGVRASRVERARARIAARFYDRADVRERVLDAVMDELMRD